MSTIVLNRYATLQDHLFQIFASSAWISEQLAIIPKGFTGSKPVQEYIEFNPVVNGAGSKDSLVGILYVEVYTTLDLGPKRAYEIADILDKYLAGKSFKLAIIASPSQHEFDPSDAVTQFQRNSNFSVRGESPGSKAFLMSNYQIQFGFYRKEL
jgi:hypothetical protein